MRLRLLLFVVGLAGLWAHAMAASQVIDLDKPVPIIRLGDGRVLKNVTFSKFGAVTVSVRSNPGYMGLRYEALPDNVRAAAELRRPGGPKWFAGDTSGNTRIIAGQVFVQTQGTGAYKFGSVDVYAFDLAALSYFDQGAGEVRLPKPIHRTTSDADGKFELKVPMDRPCFIFAEASRLRTAGPDTWTERHQWRIADSEVREGKPILLSQENESTARKIFIEQVD